jgi:protoporphyrinogen oxidase
MAPPGKTSLCTEWFCTYGDAVWETSDAEIVERTVAHLSDDLELIERGEVIGGFALRARHAYPVYTLDYAQRLDTINGCLGTYADHISIAGRGGTFRYNNTDHSIETGLLVAKNLLGEDHDVEAVNVGGGYHEAKVVER